MGVAYNGHHPWVERVIIEPSKNRDVEAVPDETVQRKLAHASIGTAGAVAAASIVLGVLSFVEFRRSRDLLFESTTTEEDFQEYQAVLATADDYRVASGTTGGVALGLFVVGGVLFAFDEPSMEPMPAPAPQAWVRWGF